MHSSDRYDSGWGLDDELPELPIPRPDEAHERPAMTAPPLASPSLGGGASFTTATPDEAPAASMPTPAPLADIPPPHAGTDDSLDSDRFTWELAARLTAGMLANPNRHHASVKDAMGMFDQLLQEMYAYTRIAVHSERTASDMHARQRRDHEAYFHGAREQGLDPAATDAAQAASSRKPEPAKPRPMEGYQALPPAAQGRYFPAGAGPRPHDAGDTDRPDASDTRAA